MAGQVLISVVDDDVSLRSSIKRLIESAGRNVEDFASAEDFLNSGRAQDSACLILDVRLPGMNGLELQRRLIASNCRLPIIFISANSDELTRTLATEAGAIAFLQKPFSEEALFSALDSSLRSYNSRSS